MAEDYYTIGQVLREKVRTSGDKDAIVFPESRLTHSQLFESASLWARTLAALGVERHDHVGILSARA